MALVDQVVNGSNIPQSNGNTFQYYYVIARTVIESTNATAGTYGQSTVNLCWGWRSTNTSSSGGYSSWRGYCTGSGRYRVNGGSYTSWFSGYDAANCYPQTSTIYHKNTATTSGLSPLTCDHIADGSLTVDNECKIVISGTSSYMPKAGTYTATATATINNVRTVSYNKNGGNSTPSAQRTLDGTAITLASAITKNATVSNTTITTSYNANGGSSTPSSQTSTKTVTTPQNFNGWHEGSASGTSHAAGSSFTPTGSNITMYAGWSNGTASTTYSSITLASAISKPNDTTTYTISFNANGGTPTPGNLTATKTTTYTFNNWHEGSATGTSHAAGSSWSPTSSKTLYAAWTSANSTTSVTLPTVTRAGYTLNGWYTASSGGTKRGNAGASYTPTQSETLYAQWTAVNYTVTIDPNGGTYSSSTSTTTLSSQHIGDTISVAEPTRPGYTFVGWVKNGSGSLSKHASDDPIFASSNGNVGVYNNSGNGAVTHAFTTTSASTTIYGSRDISITTSDNTTNPGLGGFVQTTMSAANKKYIHTFVAKIPSGYTVEHYQNATGDGRTITWLSDTSGTGSYTVYAYQHNCGSSGSFNSFGHVALATGTKPVTWQLACAIMFDITDGKSSVLTLGAGNCRLTALWVANNITLTLNANGGTVSSAASTTFTARYGTYTTSLPKAVRPGYKFKGWYANCVGTAGSAINMGRTYKYTSTISIHFNTYSTDYSGWGSYRMISCTEGGGWNVENNGSGYPRFSVYDNTAAAYKLCNFTTSWANLTPGFHSWDITLSSKVIKVYLDGVQEGTITLDGTNIKYHAINSIFVGAEAAASESSPTTPYLNGYIGNIYIRNNSTVVGTRTDRGRQYFSMPTHNVTLYAMWEPYFNVYIKGQSSGWVLLKDGYNWQN